MQFFEHFLFISDAMTYPVSSDEHLSLWNEEDGFYYDAIQWGYGRSQQLPVRSMVGLMPLYATLVLEPSVIKRFPGFKKRMDWFIENRPDISMRNVANIKGEDLTKERPITDHTATERGKGDRKLLALASKERLVRILEKMLDENEFLSLYGIRSWVGLVVPHDTQLTIDQHVAIPSPAPILDQRERRGLWCRLLAWRLAVCNGKS